MDGADGDQAPSGRLIVSRRSCDQCRSRKIGCDRLTPCSNCASARLDCTHSAIKPRTGDGRQRILISPQYEQKIDNIAQNVDGIRQLLQGVDFTALTGQAGKNDSLDFNTAVVAGSRDSHPSPRSVEPNTLLSHSKLVNKFVSDLIGCQHVRSTHPHAHVVLSSLRDMMRPEDEWQGNEELSDGLDYGRPLNLDTVSMPPQAEAIRVLRWATENTECYIVVWLCQVLSLESYTEICQRVYFAVAKYRQTDFIIANACLMWLFAEYAIVSGQRQHLEYSAQCRTNVERSVKSLPLILPANMEVIASLVLAAYIALDMVKPTLAQTLCSAAINLCQTLSYHRATAMIEDNDHTKMAKIRLLWSVYRLDKNLSFRLGHAPGLSEHDISLPPSPTVLRWARLAIIQDNIHEKMLRSAALNRPSDERADSAVALSMELQQLIDETHQALNNLSAEQQKRDPMRKIYIEAEVVAQLSVLSLISRIAPASEKPFLNISNQSLDVSRRAMDAHSRGLEELLTLTKESAVLNQHFNSTIFSAPFVPYLVVFCCVITDCSQQDLSRLQRFNESMDHSSDSLNIRPKRFFKLLYDMARLFYESNSPNIDQAQCAPIGELDRYIDYPALHAAGWQLCDQDRLHEPQPLDMVEELLRFPIGNSLDQGMTFDDQ